MADVQEPEPIAQTSAGLEIIARTIEAVFDARARIYVGEVCPGGPDRGFHACAPMVTSTGLLAGMLSLSGDEPRAPLSDREDAILHGFAALAAREVERSSQHYRHAFEHAHDPMAVASGGILVMANRAFAELFGFESPAQLIGHPLEQVIAPEERERVREYGRAREARRTAPAAYETQGLRSDGSAFDMEVRASIYAADGRIFTAVTLQDITSRRLAEEQLLQAHDKLNALIKASPLPIVAYDTDGRVTLWNPAAERAFGWSEHEVLGGPLPYIPAARLHEYEMIRSLTLQGIGLSNIEVQRQRKNRTLVDLAVSTAPLRDRRMAITGVLAMFVDVTERNRMEQRLGEAQKMEAIGRLAGGIAHDFNNLLTIINGYGQMLLDAPEDGPGSREMIEEVVAAAERAARLTNQLLAFSRRQVVEMQTVALDEQVRRMDVLLRRALGEHIELRTHIASRGCLVHANGGQMEQVIMNLALNARDAMPGGGELVIELSHCAATAVNSQEGTAAEPGDYVVLSVKDSGHGMDPDTRTRIFEPFFTTKQPGKGTGLGLATVYGIVKQHNGYIGVETETGKGTTFRVYLPRVAEPHTPAPASAAAHASMPGSETVLVVEDEVALRRLVAGMLQAEGYTVLQAASVHDAIELATTRVGNIHMLLSDVVMPGMGGPELARHIAALRPGIAIAYMSGYMDHERSQEILEQEARFLQKPFTRTALSRLVREVLDAAAGNRDQ